MANPIHCPQCGRLYGQYSQDPVCPHRPLWALVKGLWRWLND